jgi:branched-chain amino acid transport system substrate-binding protein
MLRRAAPLALAVLAVGCGSSEPSADSEVTVYVSTPDTAEGRELVAEARESLADAGGEAGGVAVRAVYLDAARDAAGIAANARRAVEDSTSIAYIGELDRTAALSSRPITAGAQLLQVPPTPEAMAQVLDAIDRADDPLDRESVADAFESG